MNYPHRIRLRGPWRCQALEAADANRTLPGDHDVDVPGSLLDQGLAGFAGVVLLTRRFGYPGRIDDGERVWLTFDDIQGRAAISLNEQPLGSDPSGPCAFDVTGILAAHNRLEVTLAATSDRDGLRGEVAMEIRALAFLDRVQVRHEPDGGLVVEGQVVGQFDDALELYGMVDREHVHYQTIRARPEGEPFAFRGTAPVAKAVRIELVYRSQIWYVVQVPLGDSAR